MKQASSLKYLYVTPGVPVIHLGTEMSNVWQNRKLQHQPLVQ